MLKKMNKKIYFLLTSMAVIFILSIIVIYTKVNNTKYSNFTTEKLVTNSSAYKKINNKVNGLIKKNGIYLLQTGEDNVSYFILDGSHMNLKYEAPYFSEVKIESKEDSILIYFSEKLKVYPLGKYPDNSLIYKITKDKDTEYIRVFKNGKETHFDSVIGG